MLYLTQLVYVHPGKEAAFHAFEDVALPLVGRYGGETLLRLRPNAGSVVASTIEAPYEIHVIRFRSEEDLARFSSDPERQRVLHLKSDSVRATLLVRGDAPGADLDALRPR